MIGSNDGSQVSALIMIMTHHITCLCMQVTKKMDRSSVYIVFMAELLTLTSERKRHDV